MRIQENMKNCYRIRKAREHKMLFNLNQRCAHYQRLLSKAILENNPDKIFTYLTRLEHIDELRDISKTLCNFYDTMQL